MRITWLGHAAFRVEFDGKAVLFDPFLGGNPAFNGDHAAARAGISHILLTHGHGDHVGDTIEIAKETGATVVSNADLVTFLAGKGVDKVEPMNTGGTVDLGGFSVTMVRADHSASLIDNGMSVAVGNANGLILKAPGQPALYHLGDTDIFSDMALIAELHEPKIGLVPIGDRYTMGPKVAALAVKRYLNLDVAIPCHYATFPGLVSEADIFVEGLKDTRTKVLTPKPGETMEVG
jgi:L-ascorbate metabolism protein UlaG (beta-lactamase superfamily)